MQWVCCPKRRPKTYKNNEKRNVNACLKLQRGTLDNIKTKGSGFTQTHKIPIKIG